MRIIIIAIVLKVRGMRYVDILQPSIAFQLDIPNTFIVYKSILNSVSPEPPRVIGINPIVVAAFVVNIDSRMLIELPK